MDIAHANPTCPHPPARGALDLAATRRPDAGSACRIRGSENSRHPNRPSPSPLAAHRSSDRPSRCPRAARCCCLHPGIDCGLWQDTPEVAAGTLAFTVLPEPQFVRTGMNEYSGPGMGFDGFGMCIAGASTGDEPARVWPFRSGVNTGVNSAVCEFRRIGDQIAANGASTLVCHRMEEGSVQVEDLETEFGVTECGSGR